MKVAVTWQMCGYVDIDADTMEEAMKKFEVVADELDLPKDGEYIDGSFEMSSDDVEEMRALSEL